MNDLALHIEYLLLSHDCVIVPGLGAFLAHRSEAHVDPSTGLLMPPSRWLGFNGDLRHNDGLLVGSVARRDRLSYEAARIAVERAVGSYMHCLEESGTLAVGSLGTLTLASGSASPVFEPSLANPIISLPTLGLSPVRLQPLADEQEGVEDEVAPVVPVRRLRPWRVAGVAASIAAVVAGFGLLFSHATLPVAERHDTASIDSGIRSRVASHVVTTPVDSIPLSREIVLNIGHRPEAPVPVAVAPVAQAPQRYILVVGSFPTRSQAERFMSSDPALGVVEMDGNYRVYAATAPTMAEATANATAVAERYPSMWICRR